MYVFSSQCCHLSFYVYTLDVYGGKMFPVSVRKRKIVQLSEHGRLHEKRKILFLVFYYTRHIVFCQ